MRFCLAVLALVVFFLPSSTFAQQATGELAATLEVLSSGVDVLRANTVNWISVKVEAIVGVGDQIRTDDTGRARITFFQDGVDTEVLPNTTYRITRFEGGPGAFNITAEVLLGQTIQRLARLLDANSSYDILTPGMSLVARGTQFAVRVEDSGRSAMLVSEGNVSANNDNTNADVPPDFGVRAEPEEALSDVVRAKTFAELDAALDGCSAILPKIDDMRLNVRVGPDLGFPAIGTVDPAEITTLVGVIESGGWYRINFREGFGWVLSSGAQIDEACAGLRIFPDNHGPEDVTEYSSLGDEIRLEDLTIPDAQSTPEATDVPAGE